MNWGCEFLDLENVQPFDRPRNADWTYIPMVNMEDLVSRNYMNNISPKVERIQNLANDIALNGLKNPGVLTVSNIGVCLTDGNHRYLAFKLLGLKEFPVIFQDGDGPIKLGGSKLDVLFRKMLTEWER